MNENKYIPKNKTVDYYLNIIEIQKKTLKIFNERVKKQEKELKVLRKDTQKTMNVLKQLKNSLILPKWRYMNAEQIEQKMIRFKQRIDELEKE